jgi:O-antigen ligase
LIALGLVGAILALAFRWPGLLIVGAIFTYQASILAGFDSLTAVFTLAALAVGLWGARSRIGTLRLNSVDLAFIAFILLCAFSVMHSEWPERAWTSFLGLSFAAASMYLIGRLCALIEPPESLAVQLLVGLVLFGAAFSLLLVMQYDGNSTRLRVGEGTAVGLSQPLPLELTAATIAVVATLAARQWRQLLFLGPAAAAIGMASILSGTRGVFVAFFAATLVALALSAKRKRVWVVIGALAAALTFLSPFLMSIGDTPVQAGLDRLMSNFEGNSMELDLSSQLRLEQQLRGIDVWQQYPILGAGVGGYDAVTGLGYPHNVFIEVAANNGIIGVSLFLIIVSLVAYNLIAADVLLARVTFVSLFVAALTHMQLSFSLDMAKAFFLLAGIAAGRASTRLISPRVAVGSGPAEPTHFAYQKFRSSGLRDEVNTGATGAATRRC